jgi:phosphatidylglycerophosphatase GEP4
MPLNIPGLLAPFQLLIHPRIVIPNLIIKGAWLSNLAAFCSLWYAQEDVRHLDFAALHKAGYRGAIFDKDNCLVCSYTLKEAAFVQYVCLDRPV